MTARAIDPSTWRRRLFTAATCALFLWSVFAPSTGGTVSVDLNVDASRSDELVVAAPMRVPHLNHIVSVVRVSVLVALGAAVFALVLTHLRALTIGRDSHPGAPASSWARRRGPPRLV